MTSRRAFVLTDAAAMVVVLTAVAVYLLIASSNRRRLVRLGDDIAHFKQIGVGTASYGADFGDLMWSFSWRAGQAPISPNDPNGAGLTSAADDLQAARNQMSYIIRRCGNRPTFPVLNNLFPYLVYSHLVLADYLQLQLPARAFVSSADLNRLKWAQDPTGYDAGLYTPNLGTSAAPSPDWRHPYGTGLRFGACFIDGNPVGQRLEQGTMSGSLLIYSGAQFEGQHLSSVQFPSQKVLLQDQFARHFGDRIPYCTHPEPRLPFLVVDGSVSIRSAANANAGWNPNSGQSPVLFTYSPSAIDPPATGPNADRMECKFLWTRHDLAGRDFGGPAVP